MEIKIVAFKEYKDLLLNIRREVFTLEQKVPEELDHDEFDDVSTHIIVKVEDDYIATGRLLPDGHIGRVAVKKSFRGQGIGRLLMRGLIEYGKSIGIKRFLLGAQLTAVGFYKSLGFESYGDQFMDAGIRHIMMELVA